MVGGTLCEAHQIRYRNSRVHVDFEDYSALSLNTVKKFMDSFSAKGECDLEHWQPPTSDLEADLSDGELSDDGFGMLSAHREFRGGDSEGPCGRAGSFVADALTGAEEAVAENDKSLLEWAEREAKELGLID